MKMTSFPTVKKQKARMKAQGKSTNGMVKTKLIANGAEFTGIFISVSECIAAHTSVQRLVNTKNI